MTWMMSPSLQGILHDEDLEEQGTDPMRPTCELHGDHHGIQGQLMSYSEESSPTVGIKRIETVIQCHDLQGSLECIGIHKVVINDPSGSMISRVIGDGWSQRREIQPGDATHLVIFSAWRENT